jgi:hypothetical protein
MLPIQKIRADVRLKKRYITLSKLILLIAIIYSLWIAFIIISVYFLGFGNRWAVITMDEWILSAVILLGIFLGLEILFIFHHYMIRRRRIEQEKPKPVLYHGKEVHTFSLPIGSQGGIFSKTYVKIDEEHIVNIRYQMISPKNLWEKKEE